MSDPASLGVTALRRLALRCHSLRRLGSVLGALMLLGTSGCLSNEYRIPKNELQRLAALPPEARGQGVRVSQKLGDRRSEALEPSAPLVPPEEVVAPPSDVELAGDWGMQVDVGGGDARRGPAGAATGTSGGWRGTPATGGLRGTPPAAAARPAAGAFRGSPHVGGGTFRGAPSGGGGSSLPSTGGGGNGNGNGAEILVVIAVVAVVAATVATVALAASEGMRYEGHAEMAPEQLVYLHHDDGPTNVVPLGELTPAQAASADVALVMDDEGYGMRRLDHAPLDRKGGVFRFELGAGMFTLGDGRASGLSAHIQGGAYLTHTFGLLVDVGLGTGTPDPCCSGSLAASGTIARHSLGLEAEVLPLALGPLHLGAFAGGGLAIAAGAGPYEAGPMVSGGALLELDLTSHLALAVRGGANTAWLPSGQSSAGSLTGGLSIY